MWYSCAVCLNTWVDDELPPVPIDFGRGVRLGRVPEWVKNESVVSVLSFNERQHIGDAQVALIKEYEAEALGSPDPDWAGSSPRGIQSVAAEQFALANVALWLAKPSRLSFGPVFHFGAGGDPTSLRQSAVLEPVLNHPRDDDAVLDRSDAARAVALFGAMMKLDRKSTFWTAIWLLNPALRQRMWEVRYLMQWVAIESLLGPSTPGETKFRLSLRIALFLGSSPAERAKIFSDAKVGYDWRSKVAHGIRLDKLKAEQSLDFSGFAEDVLRRSVSKVLLDPALLETFSGKGRDAYLDELAFST